MSFQELNNPYFVTMKQALEEAAEARKIARENFIVYYLFS